MDKRAISWQRALESGQWAAWQPKGEPVRYRNPRGHTARKMVLTNSAARAGILLDARCVMHECVTYDRAQALPTAAPCSHGPTQFPPHAHDFHEEIKAKGQQTAVYGHLLPADAVRERVDANVRALKF